MKSITTITISSGRHQTRASASAATATQQGPNHHHYCKNCASAAHITTSMLTAGPPRRLHYIGNGIRWDRRAAARGQHLRWWNDSSASGILGLLVAELNANQYSGRHFSMLSTVLLRQQHDQEPNIRPGAASSNNGDILKQQLNREQQQTDASPQKENINDDFTKKGIAASFGAESSTLLKQQYQQQQHLEHLRLQKIIQHHQQEIIKNSKLLRQLEEQQERNAMESSSSGAGDNHRSGNHDGNNGHNNFTTTTASRIRDRILNIFLFLVTTLSCAYLLLDAYILGRKSVSGPSMLPTLKPGQHCFMLLMGYHRVLHSLWEEALKEYGISMNSIHALKDEIKTISIDIQKGPIVVYTSPRDAKKFVVKRIRQIVYMPQEGKFYYWMEGDNAAESNDSRSYGYVNAKRLFGLALAIYDREEGFQVLFHRRGMRYEHPVINGALRETVSVIGDSSSSGSSSTRRRRRRQRQQHHSTLAPIPTGDAIQQEDASWDISVTDDDDEDETLVNGTTQKERKRRRIITRRQDRYAGDNGEEISMMVTIRDEVNSGIGIGATEGARRDARGNTKERNHQQQPHHDDGEQDANNTTNSRKSGKYVEL